MCAVLGVESWPHPTLEDEDGAAAAGAGDGAADAPPLVRRGSTTLLSAREAELSGVRPAIELLLMMSNKLRGGDKLTSSKMSQAAGAASREL